MNDEDPNEDAALIASASHKNSLVTVESAEHGVLIVINISNFYPGFFLRESTALSIWKEG